MKILSIHHTQYPNIDKPVIWEGSQMPEHRYNAMDDQLFNRWTAYIYNQVNKIKGINKIKPGGVAHIDGQESALRMAKEILS
jgi:hypothetical protein